MKKILGIAAAILAASMLFVACDQGVELPAGTTSGSSSGSSSDSGDASGDAEAGFTAFTVDFTKCTISDGYCGTYNSTDGLNRDPNETPDDKTDDVPIVKLNDGVLSLECWSWDNYTITMPEEKNLSKAKKMVITVKKDGEFTKPDAWVIELADKDKKAKGMDSWTDGDLFDELGDDYKDYTIDLSKLKDEGANSKFNGELDNLNAVTTIGIHPRGAAGWIVIKSIKFE